MVAKVVVVVAVVEMAATMAVALTLHMPSSTVLIYVVSYLHVELKKIKESITRKLLALELSSFHLKG